MSFLCPIFPPAQNRCWCQKTKDKKNVFARSPSKKRLSAALAIPLRHFLIRMCSRQRATISFSTSTAQAHAYCCTSPCVAPLPRDPPPQQANSYTVLVEAPACPRLTISHHHFFVLPTYHHLIALRGNFGCNYCSLGLYFQL